jgi:MtN3 and saliva related transmembrane protein
LSLRPPNRRSSSEVAAPARRKLCGLRGDVRGADRTVLEVQVSPGWVEVLGWSLAGVGALASVPQAVRTLTTRNTNGLSLTTQLCWATSWALWLYYACSIGAAPQAAGDGVGLVVDGALLVLVVRALARSRAALAHAVPLALLGGGACLLVLRIGGLEAMAVALAVFDACSLAPALWTAWRSPDATGISVTSWVLRAAVAAGWVTYAVSIGHPASAGWAVAVVPAAALIAARTGWLRCRTQPATSQATLAGQARRL